MSIGSGYSLLIREGYGSLYDADNYSVLRSFVIWTIKSTWPVTEATGGGRRKESHQNIRGWKRTDGATINRMHVLVDRV
jgi:hypothetical protein